MIAFIVVLAVATVTLYGIGGWAAVVGAYVGGLLVAVPATLIRLRRA